MLTNFMAILTNDEKAYEEKYIDEALSKKQAAYSNLVTLLLKTLVREYLCVVTKMRIWMEVGVWMVA